MDNDGVCLLNLLRYLLLFTVTCESQDNEHSYRYRFNKIVVDDFLLLKSVFNLKLRCSCWHCFRGYFSFINQIDCNLVGRQTSKVSNVKV